MLRENEQHWGTKYMIKDQMEMQLIFSEIYKKYILEIFLIFFKSMLQQNLKL